MQNMHVVTYVIWAFGKSTLPFKNLNYALYFVGFPPESATMQCFPKHIKGPVTRTEDTTYPSNDGRGGHRVRRGLHRLFGLVLCGPLAVFDMILFRRLFRGGYPR